MSSNVSTLRAEFTLTVCPSSFSKNFEQIIPDADIAVHTITLGECRNVVASDACVLNSCVRFDSRTSWIYLRYSSKSLHKIRCCDDLCRYEALVRLRMKMSGSARIMTLVPAFCLFQSLTGLFKLFDTFSMGGNTWCII